MHILSSVYIEKLKSSNSYSYLSALPQKCTAMTKLGHLRSSNTHVVQGTFLLQGIWAMNGKRSSADREMCKYYNK